MLESGEGRAKVGETYRGRWGRSLRCSNLGSKGIGIADQDDLCGQRLVASRCKGRG